MGTRPPGEWLHRVLAQCVDPQTFVDMVEPTIADLQHEVELARHDVWRCRLAQLRGYWAIGRVCLGGDLRPKPVFTRVLALAGLCVIGAALMTWARLSPSSDSRPFIGAFLLPMFLTPVVLSRTGLGTNYLRLFAACAAVALVMQGLDLGFYDLRAYRVYHAHLAFRPRDLIGFLAVIAAFSSVVAATAWQPATGHEPLARRLVLGLFFGGLTAALVLGARTAWAHDAPPIIAATRVPFYVGMFGVLLAATAAPLLAARRWTNVPLRLATMGAAFSPAAILAQSYADHEAAAECFNHFLRAPMVFAGLHLPVITGSAVLGWCLATRESPREREAYPDTTTSTVAPSAATSTGQHNN